ncbi:MAG: hypothetical protein Q8937_11620 [Bacteroidota bacterium]|nr:hypothetical protein [Bacteroidota bacterium]
MQQFPELKENQVALLRCRLRTGHVIDENFRLAISDDQLAYTVFDDVDSALHFAIKMVLSNNEIECVIYGRDKEVIKYVTLQDCIR